MSTTSITAPLRVAGRPRSVQRTVHATARLLRGASVVALSVYVLHSLVGLGGRPLGPLFEDVVYNALLGVGALLCLLRAVTAERERAAWAAMGIGLASWTAGEILNTVDPGLLAGSFPATTDLLWLGFFPATFVALGLLVRARVRHAHASLWLDGLVGSLAVAALACQFLLGPLVKGTGSSTSSAVADLIYPLGDLLLVAFVMAVLALTGWRPGRALAFVAAGVLLGATADLLSLVWNATGHSGSSAFDSLWPASAVVLGWAAWQPPRPTPTMTVQGRRLLIFPMCFALGALVLLVEQSMHPLVTTAYVCAVLTMIGVVARLGLTFSENLSLVSRSRHEALTDALTCLGNRRRLLLDLDSVLQSADPRAPWALLLFDLNGFKRYNDAFGHPLGDALLARLGGRLGETVSAGGSAYRLGGDEFCVLAPVGGIELEQLQAATSGALAERGKGFDISTSRGSVVLPLEATESTEALQRADERLYEDKRAHRRPGAPDELRDVLMQVMREIEPDLYRHLNEVAVLCRAVGRHLCLSGEDLDVVIRAAELHDLGKVAVPESILHKESGLDPAERAIVERHSEAGARILAAAAPMRPVAEVVRSVHERFDGAGYPERRGGQDIPMGARIIAVCDAFHAITTDRPYRRGGAVPEAMRELRRNAGTQFDPTVVDAFCAVLAESQHANQPVASELGS